MLGSIRWAIEVSTLRSGGEHSEQYEVALSKVLCAVLELRKAEGNAVKTQGDSVQTSYILFLGPEGVLLFSISCTDLLERRFSALAWYCGC